MWIKDKESNESYIHICDGSNEKQMRKKEIEIRLHDISIFTIIKNETGVKLEHIKYCPYCGSKLKDTVDD